MGVNSEMPDADNRAMADGQDKPREQQRPET